MKRWYEFQLFTINPDLQEMGIDQKPIKRKISIDLNEVSDYYESHNYDNDIDGTNVGMKSGEAFFLIYDYNKFKKLINENHSN